ncbi:CopD family protein [Pseudomonas frederiksbergensis]|uniref:CopD family protein n=1 Tax=Pseudomonas frederiksbergensis TaxID=104087 RepID=UPI003D04839A
MIYLLIKSLHVCAVLFWISGMFLQSLLLLAGRNLSGPLLPLELSRLRMLRRWCRGMTVPAMALTWLSGLTIATLGGWVGEHWLLLKFAFVVALSAMHGWLSGSLRRRLECPTEAPSSNLTIVLPSLLVMTCTIVFLVINKPF